MEIKTKHTPGTWEFVRDGFRITIGNKKTSPTATPHDYMVAEIADNSMQAEANARLIASAPELIEAAKAFAKLHPSSFRGSSLEAVISKAEGK